MDQATDRADDLRLNWFVCPRLEFQRAAATNCFGVGRFVQWETYNVPGKRRNQLLTALRCWVRLEAKHLLISDDPGQGKTVLSLRVEHLLCRKKTREQIFGDKLPRFIIHWMSRLPATKSHEPTLHDMLMVDPSFIQWLEKLNKSQPEPVDPRKIIDYALENDRLIIILDAYDELPEAQKILFGRLFRNTCNRVRWIITGRDWAINREIADNRFHPNEFFRLRIKAFDSELQDRYMEKALPGIDWRAALEGSKEEWDELLGLPATLRALVDAFSMSGAEPQESLRFSSPSDLFCYCSSVMLFRELKKEKNVQSLRKLDPTGAKPVSSVQRALGAVALEMALRGHWREVIKETTRDLEDEINAIWNAAKNRFLRSNPAAERRKFSRVWNWIQRFLREYQFHGGAPQADLSAQSMVFRNLRIHELNIARYLSDFATDEDLRGGSDSVNTGKVKQDQHGTNVLQYLGDEKWENTWRCAIRMPIRTGGKPHGVTDEQYKQAMLLLFERPANPELRRPTELMWIADQHFKSKRLKTLRREIRHYLGQQFLACVQDETTKETALSLIDFDNYRIVTQKAYAECDNYGSINQTVASPIVEFMMGASRELVESGIMPPQPVRVTLTEYAIGRYAVTNQQFQLFDNNFASKNELISRFGSDSQPCVFLSWYDAFWFAKFIGLMTNSRSQDGLPQSTLRVARSDGEESGRYSKELSDYTEAWQIRIPTEAQFEFAYRAGSNGDYFNVIQGNEILEVDQTQVCQYAHFCSDFENGKTVAVTDKFANAWDLRLAGNVWKWVYDYWSTALSGGENPVQVQFDTFRVCKGCGWFHEAKGCRSWFRDWMDPSTRSESLGMVLSAEPFKFGIHTIDPAKDNGKQKTLTKVITSKVIF